MNIQYTITSFSSFHFPSESFIYHEASEAEASWALFICNTSFKAL